MATATLTEHRFAADEQPTFPGSPYLPRHPVARRFAYAVAGLSAALAATLGNALVNVNSANIGGAMGLYAAEAALLPAIYVAMNASANLLLIKARIQFGIPRVTHGLLILYAAAALLQLAHPDLVAAMIIRGVSGLAAAGLTTLVIYDMLQAFPAKVRPMALVVAINLPQLGTPLARVFPVEMLALGSWQGLHLIELALALTALAALTAMPLPPSVRSKAFEPLDFVTFALLAPAITFVCLALGQGRYVWWTDTVWLGWALAAAVPLFAAAIIVEHRRKRPLLQIDWIGSTTILRFAAVALLVRFALAEQTYGAVGLLTSSGLTNDQLRTLFAIVVGAQLIGVAASLVTMGADRIPHQIFVAALAIALGAWLDSHASNITRPEQLYVSQALIAFGAALFIGPALLYGFLRMMERGPEFLVSFIVLFNLTQNIGGLAGSAFLGTYQTARAEVHAQALSEHLLAADPIVAARIQSGAARLSGAIADPAGQGAQGANLLTQAMNREATLLAFNDTFRLVMLLALLTAAYLFHRILVLRRARRQARMEVPA